MGDAQALALDPLLSCWKKTDGLLPWLVPSSVETPGTQKRRSSSYSPASATFFPPFGRAEPCLGCECRGGHGLSLLRGDVSVDGCTDVPVVQK